MAHRPGGEEHPCSRRLLAAALHLQRARPTVSPAENSAFSGKEQCAVNASAPGMKPHFGFAHGLAVHLSRFDHLPAGNVMQRFNKKLAAGITSVIGTMWTAYVFALLSLCSLP